MQTPTQKPAPTPSYVPMDPTRLPPDSNFPLAVVVGAVAAVAGAGLWALVTVVTGYQLGLMAIAVGVLVGLAIRHTGRGSSVAFSLVGAGFALAGCVLGNVLTIVGFVSQQGAQPFFSVLSRLEVSVVPSMLVETFNPMDLLFYAIAVYEGYKLSINRSAAA